MKRWMVSAVTCLVIASVAVAPASANLLFNGDFEINGGPGSIPAGWNLWLERGGPIVGAEAGSIGPAGAWVAGVHGQNLNGGIWQAVPVPIGSPLFIDGFWASHPTSPQSQWGEVIVFDGVFVPTPTVDVNPGVDGNLLNGELIFKNDTWATAGGWSGQISATSPVANNGPMFGQSTTGVITVILKAGNIGGSEGVDFDNMTLVPEPTSMLVLCAGLGGLILRRKR